MTGPWRCQSATGICPQTGHYCPPLRGAKTVSEAIHNAEQQHDIDRYRLAQKRTDHIHGGTA